MPYIYPKGQPTSRIWFIFAVPYASCVSRGSLLSGGMGGVFLKMLQEAGIEPNVCFFTSRAPNTDEPHAFQNLEASLAYYKPPFVVVVGGVAGWFLPDLRGRNTVATDAGQLDKYAGSLLEAPNLDYPHFCIPMYGPERAVQDWTERNVTVYVDLQKLKDEFLYWQKYGQLQKLPERTLIYQDIDFDELLSHLERFKNAKMLADDIENPFYDSKEYGVPGYPFLMGLADSAKFGISFKLFRENPSENRILWRTLDELFYNVPVLLGQNFFNYDALYHKMLGFRVRLDSIQDTLIRHHILWPELSHKLQFMTRQYTREPYYKDEGHGWTFKHLDRYRRYNCLDACVTYEIWEAQEEEFKQRPHLR